MMSSRIQSNITYCVHTCDRQVKSIEIDIRTVSSNGLVITLVNGRRCKGQIIQFYCLIRPVLVCREVARSRSFLKSVLAG